MTNGLKKFIPFHQIKAKETIVVDGLHPQALTLSHWKGANCHAQIEADTSGEIVLNAIKEGFEGLDKPYVSATHFDIDGFVGVFALFYPQLAMQYFNELKEMARIGDFREYDPSQAGADTALKLCSWMNKVEKEQFYRPFEEKDEIKACVPKFDYFLNQFPAVLKNPDLFKEDWEEEYQSVMQGLEHIIVRKEHPQLGLIIVKVEKPIHYYALFSKTDGFDLVLSIYPEQRYELEMKYTSWIDLASRSILPRVDLRPLAAQLNQLEKSDYFWRVDQITDTGPILRLEKDQLSKADRYANPDQREIFASSINESEFSSIIIEYLSKAYQNVSPKRFWTWKEMKGI